VALTIRGALEISEIGFPMEHVRLDVTPSASECFARIFDAIGFGTVLLGDRGQVLQVSEAAKQHLGAGMMIKSGSLAATDTTSDRVLQDILSAHLNGGNKERSALGLHRLEQRPLILRIVPMTQDMQARFDGAHLIAVLVDPEICPEPSPALLNQLFGLTRKEALVATYLMCGSTIQEMAKETGVGVGTIRTQSKTIFAKTGTKRQAELVGLLTRLAVISHDAG
jgi:DNA-binding CsgD family transcriptional regulator